MIATDYAIFDSKPAKRKRPPNKGGRMGDPPKYSLVDAAGKTWSVRELSEELSTYEGRTQYPPELRNKMYAKLSKSISNGQDTFSYYGLSFKVVLL